MDVNPKFLTPCGLYCGICAIYYATRDDNRKFKERLVHVYRGRVPGSEDLGADDIHLLVVLPGSGARLSPSETTGARKQGL